MPATKKRLAGTVSPDNAFLEHRIADAAGLTEISNRSARFRERRLATSRFAVRRPPFEGRLHANPGR
jgi:hypothetical protein